jgi:hypothetical protein
MKSSAKNFSYTSSVFDDCDNSLFNLIFFSETKVQNGTLIQSIIFDLIVGIVLSGLTFQFYRGIEISHPVYSVLFSNIVFGVVSSFLSFIGVSYSYVGQSCDVLWLLTVYNDSNSIIVNIVTLTTIAYQRYTILIATKAENNTEDLDLPRTRNISLATNWAIIVVMLVIRAILHLPSLSEEVDFFNGVSRLKRIPIPAMLLVCVATTFAVYYKTDVKLKQRLESQQYKSQHTQGKRKDSGNSFALYFIDCTIL